MLDLRLPRLFAPVLLAGLAAGCAAYSGVRFAPSPFEVAVAPDAGAPAVGRAIFAWDGIVDSGDGYVARFLVRLGSDADAPLRIDPAGCQLVDASLDAFGAPTIERVDGDASAGAYVVPPRGTGVWRLAFPFDGDPAAADLDGLHLTLALEDDQGGIRVSATFDRLRREPVDRWHGSVFYGSGWHLHGGSDGGLGVSAGTTLRL